MKENNTKDTRRTHWDGCWQIHPYCEIDKLKKDIEELIVYTDKLSELAKNKQEWISVNDKLPDKDGYYLVYANIAGWSIRKIYTCAYINNIWDTNNTVISWMIIPEQPEVK